MRTGSASVDELIAHGGWALDDAQARHAAHPDTFVLPAPDKLERLLPGTSARLIFQIADQADPLVDRLDPYDDRGRPNLVVAHERMWLWVESVSGPSLDAELVGVLMNNPVATHSRLVPGARVRFRRSDVIDVDLEPPVAMAEEFAWMESNGFPLLAPEAVEAPEDPLRNPTIAPAQAEVCARHGVRPQRPSPVQFVRCIVGRSLADGVWPVFGARAIPDPDRGDCGWSIWAVHSDMLDADKSDGLEVIPVTEVFDRNRDAWRYLALPPGWAFMIGPDGFEDVYQDPELLTD